MIILTENIFLKVSKEKPFLFTGKIIRKFLTEYLKNGKLHRYYGPATIWSNKNKEKNWYFNYKYYGDTIYGYSQKKFLKDLHKEILK